MDEILKERMLRTLKASADEKWGQLGDRDKVLRDIYLSDPNGCLPDDYLSDDVMSDIISKFYWVLDAIREEFEEFIEVYVIPSYEDDTTYLMIYKSKVPVKGHSKAWNFWWETPEELMDFMYEIYCSISKCLTETVINPQQGKESWEPEMAIIIEGGIINTVATRGKGFTYRVIDIDSLKTGEPEYLQDCKPDVTNIDIEQFSAQAAGNTLWGRRERKKEG